MNDLTICYLTNRREPHTEWFFRSLDAQNPPAGIRVVVVDHFKNESVDKNRSWSKIAKTVYPKPNIWNGPHSLTKEDWFAAGSARNTGIAMCRTPWIAFVDDLTVLRPGWLDAAMEATTRPRTITCGAYRKVKKLLVDENGQAVSWEQFEGGIDSRQRHVDPDLTGDVCHEFPAGQGGQWLFGCSLVAPLEAFLEINGWCEDFCGGIGFEDCVTGLVLENAGYRFRYNTRMMTFESEEHHHLEKPFRKSDKGVSPNDKSHAVLDRTRNLKRFDNDFDLRAMREDVLAGKLFPIPTGPTRDWYDGQLISEMT